MSAVIGLVRDGVLTISGDSMSMTVDERKRRFDSTKVWQGESYVAGYTNCSACGDAATAFLASHEHFDADQMFQALISELSTVARRCACGMGANILIGARDPRTGVLSLGDIGFPEGVSGGAHAERGWEDGNLYALGQPAKFQRLWGAVPYSELSATWDNGSCDCDSCDRSHARRQAHQQGPRGDGHWQRMTQLVVDAGAVASAYVASDTERMLAGVPAREITHRLMQAAILAEALQKDDPQDRLIGGRTHTCVLEGVSP